MTSFELHLTEGKAGTETYPISPAQKAPFRIRLLLSIDSSAISYSGGSLGITFVLLEISLLLHLGYISRKQICVFQNGTC